MHNIWDRLFWALNDRYIDAFADTLSCIGENDETYAGKKALQDRIHAACQYCRRRYFQSKNMVV